MRNVVWMRRERIQAQTMQDLTDQRKVLGFKAKHYHWSILSKGIMWSGLSFKRSLLLLYGEQITRENKAE